MLHNFAFKNRLHHLCAAAIAIFSYLLSGDECKAVIKTLESKSPAITLSNGQYQTAGMFCQMSRKLHKITDHRTYSSAMYFLPAGSILLFQRFLPYDSKDIICDHCQLQHQFVALKLSRRESFNIHVRLDFTVILLTFSVGMVKINDGFVWQGSVCPVCAQFYIGYDKILPISLVFLDFTNWPVSNNLNLLEVFFWVNSLYSLRQQKDNVELFKCCKRRNHNRWCNNRFYHRNRNIPHFLQPCCAI